MSNVCIRQVPCRACNTRHQYICIDPSQQTLLHATLFSRAVQHLFRSLYNLWHHSALLATMALCTLQQAYTASSMAIFLCGW